MPTSERFVAAKDCCEGSGSYGEMHVNDDTCIDGLPGRYHFCCNFSLVSWNSSALFGSVFGNHAKQKDRSEVFAGLYRVHDIVFVQETHGVDADLVNPRKIFPTHRF